MVPTQKELLGVLGYDSYHEYAVQVFTGLEIGEIRPINQMGRGSVAIQRRVSPIVKSMGMRVRTWTDPEVPGVVQVIRVA